MAGPKANENTNGEHFAELNSSNKAHAFVREAFQNSIDGALDDNQPVRIRIYFSGESGAKQPLEWRKYFESLLRHVEESLRDLPLSREEFQSLRISPCKFVVIEDFGTSGLTGAVDAWNLASGATEENHFYHFFRTVGRSGKTQGRLGSWGIGKFVFLMASQLRAMVGLTVPATGPAAGQPLLMGQATLRYHVLDGVSYINDGWLAEERSEDGLALPMTNVELINEFRRDWSISRKDEPGFSVLIPFADELDSYEILKTIIDEYSGRILDGTLEVVLEDADYGEDEILTKDSLLDYVERYRGDVERPEWNDIIRKVDALSWYLTKNGEADIELTNNGLSFKRGEWDFSKVEDELKVHAQDLLESEGRVCVRIPVMIFPHSRGKDVPAKFDLVIGKINGPRRSIAPEFFRKWLRIGGKKQSGLSGYESYLMVGEGVLNELLRDAEGPAHTEWSDKRDRFRGKYKHGANWIKFIKSAPSQVTGCLFGSDNERDTTALVDLFPKGRQGEGPQGGKGNLGGGRAGITPGKPVIPVGTDPQIDLAHAEDGFLVQVGDSGLVRLEIAFDVARGNPFSKWHRADFIADDLSVSVVEGSALVVSRAQNQLVLRFPSSVSTKVLVTGFRDERDLRVRASWLEGVE